MTRTRLVPLLLFSLLAGLVVVSLDLANRSEHTVYGTPQTLGNGTVRSFVAYDVNGQPQSLGVVMTADALENLPTQPPPMGPARDVIVPLPDRGAVPPFDHIVVDWNPRGHEPQGTYSVPHFDIHFYMMTEAERNKIDPNAQDFEVKASRHPDAEFLPVHHVLAPDAVPRMGNRWIDAIAPALNGRPVSTTFIYGSWDAAITFLEPMITKEYLESVRDTESRILWTSIPQPAAVEMPGHYPTAYSIQFDDQEQTYLVGLDGLVRRSSSLTR